MKIKLNENTFFRAIGDDGILMDIQRNELCIVNSTGASIISICEDTWVDYKDLCCDLINIYEEKNVNEFCIPFIDELLNNGTLSRSDGINEKFFNYKVSIKDSKSDIKALDKIRNSNLVPFEAYIEVTQKCNLKCKHCYNDHQNRKELSTEEIKRIIDELYKLGTFYITLTGGEPSIRNDFQDIVEHAKKKKICLKIKSNGNIINHEKRKILIEPHIREIHFSIYSMIPSEHEFVTNTKGSLTNTLDFIEYLRKESNCKITINCPLTNAVSFDGLKKLYEYTLSRNLDLSVMHPITKGADFSIEPLQMRVSKEKLLQFYNNPETNKIIFQKGSINGLENEKKEDLLPERLCFAGSSLLAINAYGDVFPCIAWQRKCGNIMEESLSKIWFDSSVLNEIRDIQKSDLACDICDYKKSANKCPGTAFTENGNLYSSVDSECDMCRLLQNRVEL